MGFLSKIVATMAFTSQVLAVKIRADYDGGKFLSYIPFDDSDRFAIFVSEDEAEEFTLENGNLFSHDGLVAQFIQFGSEPYPSYRPMRFGPATSGWDFWTVEEDGRLIADQSDDGFGIEKDFLACQSQDEVIVNTVTGENISKTELKRRQKQRERDTKKQEKVVATTAGSSAQTPTTFEINEEKLTSNQYFEIRSRVVKRLIESGDPYPYPHKFDRDYDLNHLVSDFGHLRSGEEARNRILSVAGRIYKKRASGNRLLFYDIRGNNGVKVQVLCQAQSVRDGAPPFEKQHEHLRRGDHIGVIGYAGRTRPKKRIGTGEAGELSIFATEVILLAPCLHQLPDEYYGFKDQEQRYRKRYLDLIMNPNVFNTFRTRTRIIKYIRRYLDDAGFEEVETPILNMIAGGATAKPFTSYLNDYSMDVFLRIAPELPLKMLIVGGFDKVYEIGRLFRNEGADLTHNPEFTICEFYEAYADFNDLMTRTEELLSGLVKHLTGGYTTTFTNQHGETYTVNWRAPWRRIEMIPALEAATGEVFPAGDQLHTDGTRQFLKRVLDKVGVACPEPQTTARMLDRLTGEFIESTAINPTFIIEHPKIMSPLAKDHRSKPGLTERFEAFVCKKEIANAYTELNQPFEQRLRFEEQASQKTQGDDEAQVIDETFLNAMEHALPPTAGWGLGVDRLVMFLTNNCSIRDVLLFPFMIPEQQQKGNSNVAEGEQSPQDV
ncbi:lysyl-tRNA synthetase [Diatrype stigma]|uniref:Lysine--tRNA ligase n=1 Tax=Diatrype stigma TaxID=117547 RepID=A0AAN9UZ18_9PEZI